MWSQNICTLVFTARILSEIPLPWCDWLQEGERLWVIHLTFSFKAFSAYHQHQMAFVSSVSLVGFYLVRNTKISNSLFTNPAPTSFQVQPKPAKELWFCKKQLSVHFVVLCESLTKPSEFYEFFPIPTVITGICYFPSFLNAKRSCCPRQRILIRYSFFM